MDIAVERSAFDAMCADAAARAPEEACGLLLGTPDRITSAIAAQNQALDRARAFEIDPAMLLSAQRQERAGGPRVVGYYHSHPNGAPFPSAVDADRAVADGRLWVIVARGAVHAYRAVTNGPIHGRFAPARLQVA